MTAVKYNRATDRLHILCDCGEAISLPGSGDSSQRCPCGIGWAYRAGGLEKTVISAIPSTPTLSIGPSSQPRSGYFEAPPIHVAVVPRKEPDPTT